MIDLNIALLNRYENLGRENFSSHSMRRTINGIAFLRKELLSGILLIFPGSHSVRRPNIICNEAMMVLGIRTSVVMPPDGMGNEGININSRNRTAKLFSPKKMSKSCTVLLWLCVYHFLSSTLKS